ncbi:hypothetical protein MTP99_000704 [Tenebrio molitor]|nr:hypothetical protein MTP99_000704 [Tenebrio molitor]
MSQRVVDCFTARPSAQPPYSPVCRRISPFCNEPRVDLSIRGCARSLASRTPPSPANNNQITLFQVWNGTSTLKTSEVTHALSWITSLMETPIEPITLHSSDIPPGLSLTVTLNLTSLPSAASPLSKQRPKMVVSMLPPLKINTTLKVYEVVVAVYRVLPTFFL